jgi:hypothetical protein
MYWWMALNVPFLLVLVPNLVCCKALIGDGPCLHIVCTKAHFVAEFLGPLFQRTSLGAHGLCIWEVGVDFFHSYDRRPHTTMQ